MDPFEMASDNGMRSLICNTEGIVVAEIMYRCMKCSVMMSDAELLRTHYYDRHGHPDEDDGHDDEDEESDQMSSENYTEQDLQSSAIGWNMKSEAGASASSVSLSNSHPTLVRSLNAGFLAIQYHETNGNVSGETSGRQEDHHHQQLQQQPQQQHQCAVCGVVRSAHVLKRYGQMSCQVCYKFFRTFFHNPRIYACPQLGSCNLTVRNRCRACWIRAAASIFPLDGIKSGLFQEFAPRLGSHQVVQCENTMPLDLRKPVNENRTVSRIPKKKIPSGHRI